MKAIITIVCSAASFTAGFFVAKKLLKEKYKQEADADISATKEMLEQKYKEKMSKFTTDKPPINEYTEMVKRTATFDDEPEREIGEVTISAGSEPYVISVDEFGDDDYDAKTLLYYADGVITDEDNQPINEPEKLIGNLADIPLHFGEYVEDAVYIRNEAESCDYEILKENLNFRDYIQKKG